MNQKLLRQVCYVLNIHNDIKNLIKISNFSKFADYITDSVRLVWQNSRYLVGIINKKHLKIDFNTLCLPIFIPYAIIYQFLNFDRFILLKSLIYGEKKSIGRA